MVGETTEPEGELTGLLQTGIELEQGGQRGKQVAGQQTEQDQQDELTDRAGNQSGQPDQQGVAKIEAKRAIPPQRREYPKQM